MLCVAPGVDGQCRASGRSPPLVQGAYRWLAGARALVARRLRRSPSILHVGQLTRSDMKRCHLIASLIFSWILKLDDAQRMACRGPLCPIQCVVLHQAIRKRVISMRASACFNLFFTLRMAIHCGSGFRGLGWQKLASRVRRPSRAATHFADGRVAWLGALPPPARIRIMPGAGGR